MSEKRLSDDVIPILVCVSGLVMCILLVTALMQGVGTRIHTFREEFRHRKAEVTTAWRRYQEAVEKTDACLAAENYPCAQYWQSEARLRLDAAEKSNQRLKDAQGSVWAWVARTPNSAQPPARSNASQQRQSSATPSGPSDEEVMQEIRRLQGKGKSQPVPGGQSLEEVMKEIEELQRK